MNDVLKGSLLMICAAMLIPLGDAVAKFAHLTFGVPISFMAWSRFALGAVLLAPFALKRRIGFGELTRWPVLLRGATISATVWFILKAVSTEPIANVYGAFFIAPILSFGLAVVLLGERPSRVRVLLTCLGFVGVLLVVRPGIGLSTGMGFALLSGVFYALYLTANRWLAGTHRGMAMLWAQLIVGGLVMAPFGMSMDGAVWSAGLALCVLISASTSAFANLMIVEGYRLAEATRLAPLVYVQLIAATSYGVLFFGTFPDAIALFGLGLLIASGFAALTLKRN